LKEGYFSRERERNSQTKMSAKKGKVSDDGKEPSEGVCMVLRVLPEEGCLFFAASFFAFSVCEKERERERERELFAFSVRERERERESCSHFPCVRKRERERESCSHFP
jgi:hypothetical protein